jgi:hypothetical protein
MDLGTIYIGAVVAAPLPSVLELENEVYYAA